MNPKYRPAILFGITFALMAPLLGFMMYYSLRFPSGQWPGWFTNTIAVWFIANFVILILIIKRVFKNQASDPRKASRALAQSKSISLRLVILWSAFFVYGVIETIEGKFPLKRAIPAGAFLLFFIGLFGWSLYRTWRRAA
jgi:hypothetical protein